MTRPLWQDVDIDWLWARGRVIADSTGCHVWTASRTSMTSRFEGGYGTFHTKDRGQLLAHRAVIELYQGPFDGYACHRCDKPFCINPEHLYVSSADENNRDARGRLSRPDESIRFSWDEVWMSTALAIAERSRCVRRRAGATIVASDNRILAAGFNGAPRGFPDEGTCDAFCPRTKTGGSLSYDDCVASHAEMNALMHSDRNLRLGGTIYVTSCPCFTCAKMIANSGLAAAKFRITSVDHMRHPERSVKMLMDSGIYVEILPNAPLGNDLQRAEYHEDAE